MKKESRIEDVSSRRVQSIIVTILHGMPFQVATIDAAIHYVEGYAENGSTSAPIFGYEVDVRFTNGDTIHATFRQKGDAVHFLKSFQ